MKNIYENCAFLWSKKYMHTVCNKDDGNFLKFQVKVTVQRITI